MFCTNCGGELKSDAELKFCENCGFKLLQTQKEENFVKTNISLKRDLFDLNYEYYILKNDYWKTGSGYIFDAQNKSIGLVDGKKKKKIELKEVDNTITATINFKSGSFRGATELKDQNENLIAKLTKKRISDFNAIYFLEDPSGIRWYRATGEFINFQFQIEDLSINKSVAECKQK